MHTIFHRHRWCHSD